MNRETKNYLTEIQILIIASTQEASRSGFCSAGVNPAAR
jgi:hypothetical protein